MTKELMTMGGAKGQELLTALVKHEPGWLDRPAQEIAAAVKVGRQFLHSEREVLKEIKKIAIAGGERSVAAVAQLKARNEIALAVSEGWFDAMAAIGEIYADTPPARGKLNSKRALGIGGKAKAMEALELTPYTGIMGQKIMEHPDVVLQITVDAKARDAFPSLGDFLASIGNPKVSGQRRRSETAETAMKLAVAMQLKVNAILTEVVEHLDQVERETAMEYHDALQRTWTIWQKKAPAQMRKLARGISNEEA